VVPVAGFVVGLVITGFSYQLAKHKTLARRNAARAGKPAPKFTNLLWRNSTWDSLPLVTFSIAVALGLWQLSRIQLPAG
jgi:hypothetical protein